MTVLRAVILFLSMVMILPVQGQKKVYFTSLEWPPYSGENLRGQGASVAVARAAFEVMGYELHVDFYPWARTVGLAKAEETHYHGYFPEYYSPDIEQAFLFSDAMGQGPLGFAELKARPMKWNSLDDLSRYKVGVVRGYVNTEALDQRIRDGRIKAEAVVADSDNLRKLSKGRLDLAVIDPNVFHYLLSHDPSLEGLARQVRMNQKLLETKDLYLCFKNNEEGRELRAIFNEGLRKIDVKAIMDDFLQQE